MFAPKNKGLQVYKINFLQRMYRTLKKNYSLIAQCVQHADLKWTSLLMSNKHKKIPKYT